MPASDLQVLTTPHTLKVHDVQLDSLGLRFATCSSDKSILIYESIAKHFEVNNPSEDPSEVDVDKINANLNFDLSKFKQTATLRGHGGPVWALSWCHPQFGPPLLASCSDDGQVKIWTKKLKHQNKSIYKQDMWYCLESFSHVCSVSSINWAPPYPKDFSEVSNEPSLAVSLFNGSVLVYGFKIDSQSDTVLKKKYTKDINPESNGNLETESTCTGVSWHPSKKQIAFSCEDGLGIANVPEDEAESEPCFFSELKNNWVQDVAFSPCPIADPIIAACSMVDDDGILSIFKGVDYKKNEGVDYKKLYRVTLPKRILWKLTWSDSGDILVVSTTHVEDEKDEKIFMFKRPVDDDSMWLKIDADEM